VNPGLPGRLGVEDRDDREQRHVRVAHDDAARGSPTTGGILRHQIGLAEHDRRARLLKILEIALRGKK